MTEHVPPSKVLARKEVKELFSTSNSSELKENDFWFLINQQWWEDWKHYVNYDELNSIDLLKDSANPAFQKINNEELLSNNDINCLKPELIKDHLFTLLPQPVWNRLLSWYGGGPEIKRTVIRAKDGNNYVEIYPLRLRFQKNQNEEIVMYFSRSETIYHIKLAVCEYRKWMVPPAKHQLYVEWRDSRLEALNERDTAEISGLVDDQLVYVCPISDPIDVSRSPAFQISENSPSSYRNHEEDQEDRDGDIEMATLSSSLSQREASISIPSSSTSFSSTSHPSWENHEENDDLASRLGSFMDTSITYQEKNQCVKGEPIFRGLTGLNNLENTCFMNAALQCLSSVLPLTKYFLSHEYERDINRSNPLGMKGLMAEKYGELLNQMWCGEYYSIYPREFKKNSWYFCSTVQRLSATGYSRVACILIGWSS